MEFVVAEECLQLGLRSGALLFRGVRVGSASASLRDDTLREAELVRQRYATAEAIRVDPAVMAFQDILRQAGVNPHKEKPSLEKLLGLAHRRGDLPAINNFVDAYNLVSVRTGCSLGAHDVDRIKLPVTLRFLTGNETFTALGEDRPRRLPPTEFAYVDGADRVLCRLDILQADFSKVTPESRDVLLIVEGTEWHGIEAVSAAMSMAREVVTRYCGGEAEVLATPVE